MPDNAPTPDAHLAPRALLIDPDTLLRKSWEKALRAEGFAVTGTPEAEAGLILTASFKPDIIVLDLRLRSLGTHRAAYFAEIRSLTDAYLIGVTDQSDELERVRLLRAGADDVVSKPISTIELAARLRALLRRPRRITEGIVLGPPPTVMRYGPLHIDLGRRQARINDTVVNLTRIEFDLLGHLCQHPRDVSTREELLRTIWGEHWVGDDHVVDVHLSNLRRKLHHRAPETNFIATVRASDSDSTTSSCDPHPTSRPDVPDRLARTNARARPRTGCPATSTMTISVRPDRRAARGRSLPPSSPNVCNSQRGCRTRGIARASARLDRDLVMLKPEEAPPATLDRCCARVYKAKDPSIAGVRRCAAVRVDSRT